ncbi:acetyl-CoA carboxylase carboxyl transferase subunit beta [Aerococcaceae bacterium DSM 111176]|nr:acetyl-CoA carboxylase carboxyl transferase subunit beta [Aerococcaceae bacterium DSM 111176]
MSKLFRRYRAVTLPTGKEINQRTDQLPDNIVERCPSCNRFVLQSQIAPHYVCAHCDYHLVFPARERANWITGGNFEEINEDLIPNFSEDFPGYEEKHAKLRVKTGVNEAVLTGVGKIGNYPVGLGIMLNDFLMGSMGTVVGTKLTQLFDYATENELPVILYIASGGARMQESILSLMQMAKVSQAVERHSQAGLFYCSILTNPTTGGVTASFAMQGDVIIAEPNATIGFAGKRVIEQTINSKLPDDFQKAETVLENGFIDNIVSRENQSAVLQFLLATHQKSKGGHHG